MAGDRMTWRASVAETETPGLFGASLQLPGDQPFGSVIGPSRTSVARALAWARARADVVTLREGSTVYSAGAVKLPTLPEWPDEDRPAPIDPHPQPDASGPFVVRASACWNHPDCEAVSRRFADALSELDGVSEVAREVDGKRFEVRFVIHGGSLEAAEERASTLLAETWLGLGIEVHEGDVEVTGLTVRAAG